MREPWRELRAAPVWLGALAASGFCLMGMRLVAVLAPANQHWVGWFWAWAVVGGPAFVISLIVAFAAFSDARARRKLGWRAAGLSLGTTAAVVVAICAVVEWATRPPAYLAWEFDGRECCYQLKLFTLKEGQRLPGPVIENPPYRLRFPDLNGDGARDLQVDNGLGRLEYVYLPDGPEGVFWRQSGGYGFEESKWGP